MTEVTSVLFFYQNYHLSGEKSGEVDPGDDKIPDLPPASNHPQCREQYKVLIQVDRDLLNHNLIFRMFELLWE